MVNYRLIIEYHQKGNNNTQVATLCSCSRMTVWKVLNRERDAWGHFLNKVIKIQTVNQELSLNIGVNRFCKNECR